MGLVLFVASNGLALFAAGRLLRALMPELRGVERALLVAVGVPLLVLPTLMALGLVGWLKPWPATLAIAAWATGLELWARRAGAVQATVNAAPHVQAQATSIETFVSGATAGLVALQLAAVIGQQCFEAWVPQWDDISYHAPMAAHWLQAGRLVLAPYNYHAYYPGSGELFAAWFMLPTRQDAFAALAGLYWVLVSVLAVAALARRLGAGTLGALVAVAMFLGCKPLLPQAASFAAVDLGAAALLATALAVALGVDPLSSRASLRGRVVYMGCLSGLSIGMKITSAPVAAALLAWSLWQRRSRLREALEVVTLFVACVLLCGGYWYLRNFLVTANPLFPAKVWIFDGPLDATSLRPTALLFHLLMLQGAALQDAFWKLLDWPSPVACLFLGAYVLSTLVLLRPGFWNSARDRRIALCFVAGMGALVTSVAGPFSGAANAQTVHLQVRLRFFLFVALVGVPLFAGYLGRTRTLKPWLALAVTALVARVSPYPALELALALGAGAVVATTFGSSLPGTLSWPRSSALQLGACVLLASVCASTMPHKALLNERKRSELSPAWSSLSVVPAAARTTWFSTAEGYKYYLGFGPTLEHSLVAVEWDGAPFRLLHEYWRRNLATWWNASPPPTHMATLVENLQTQRIEYVLLMRRSSGEAWSSHMKILTRSKRVHVVKRQATYALLRIDEAGR